MSSYFKAIFLFIFWFPCVFWGKNINHKREVKSFQFSGDGTSGESIFLDFSPNVEIKLGSLSGYSGGLSVWAGPYFGVGLWDNSTYVSRGPNPLKPTTFVTTTTSGESFSRDLRRVEMGFKVGLGIVSQNFVSLGETY